ncbi:MAG TPA: aldo/keto reductase [Thermoanaerobaculia bacterium]|nr:aldo/keto reductase [Thermoanaerobaculia bacterium]
MTHEIPHSIIRGGWQLAPGHQLGDTAADGLKPILHAIESGFRVFDCADIYPGVEAWLGEARARAAESGIAIRVHTKCVPDRDALRDLKFTDVEAIVDRSLRRLRCGTLDLVQFHWWDHAVPRHIEVLQWLDCLRQGGKLRAIGLTNFDHARLQQILDSGIEVHSIQVQHSLVDRRIEPDLLPLCRERGIKVYTYGGLLGGFLGEAWLDLPKPPALANRSLVKYQLIIEDWGGWDRFQGLVSQLRSIADAHECRVAQVAIAALLAPGHSDAVIVGISPRRFREQNAELAKPIALSPDELAKLWSWECPLTGGVYELERSSQKHASIMKYNLNREADGPRA